MKSITKIENGYLFIDLSGDIYVRDADHLRFEMLEKFNTGNYHFVLDMSKVTHIDSAGLGVLIQLHKRVMPHQGSITIKGASGVVKELLHLTRMERIFKLVDTLN